MNGWMKKVVTLTLAAMAVATAGCNSGPDNRASCEAYVEQINSLECFSGSAMLNPQTTCSGYDSTTCDISGYFDCLTDNTECMTVGGVSVPDTSGIASCASLATCD